MSDDASEDVKEAVAKEFDRLRSVLTGGEKKQAKNKDAVAVNHEAVVLTLLQAVQKSEYVFRNASGGSGGDATAAKQHGGVISKTVGAAYQLAKTLTSAFSHLLTAKQSDSGSTQSNIFYAPDGYIFTMLEAVGSATSQVDSATPVLTTELLSAVLEAVVKSTAGTDALSVELKRGGSAPLTATSTGTRVIGSSANMLFMNAQLIRQSVSLLRNTLLLFCDRPALRAACRDAGMVQGLLSYLQLPDADLSNSISQCVAILCSDVRDVNYIATVNRLLHNKVAALTKASSSAASTTAAVVVSTAAKDVADESEYVVVDKAIQSLAAGPKKPEEGSTSPRRGGSSQEEFDIHSASEWPGIR